MSSFKLNKSQSEVVNHIDGPLLVVAGAGTGKTKVIVDRISKLIDDGINPESILALTFTEKAAAEMLDRVNEVRGGYSLDTTILTYNAFGSEILNQYSVDLGLGPNLKLLGETGKLVFLREHLDSFKLDYFSPVSKPDSQLKFLTEYVSKLKQQLITPEEYLSFAKELPSADDSEKLEKIKQIEIAGFYKNYIGLCREKHVIDYDDQIYLSVELLQSRPNVLNELQQKFVYILVDEFQDTNPMQSKMLDLIAEKNKNYMVVGDDDQSIYGWRGATLENILSFKNRYPSSKEISLTQNYRSTQPILDSAYALIQNNNPARLEVMNSLDKKLSSNTEGRNNPQVLHFGSYDSELNWITDDIEKRLKNGQDPGSIAVLARRNYGVKKAHEVLEYRNIKHVVAGLSSSLYQHFAVKVLLDALRATNDVLDNTALYHTLGGPLFSIDQSILANASADIRRSHATLQDQLEDKFASETSAALELIDKWRSFAHEKSISMIAYDILSDSGWKDELYKSAESDPEIAHTVQALGQFFKTLNEFERVASSPSVFNYLDSLETLMSDDIELEDDSLKLFSNSVNVLSVHKAKGLEWETVYITDCTEGSFPMRKFGSSTDIPEELVEMSEADDHMSEERRLMYVASTRAEIDLYLTYSDTHNNITKRRPSRFIEEFGSTINSSEISTDSEETDQLELLSESSGSVSIPSKMLAGDKIVLNVTEISNFLRCPLDFYYRHILNVPREKEPAAEYGSLVHSVIQQINEAKKTGKNVDSNQLVAETLANLPEYGYMSKEHKEKAHKQAKKNLNDIVDRIHSEPTPDYIEFAFRVDIPSSDLVMQGRIDAAYEQKQGVEIRDYKTGTSVNSPESAKKRAQGSKQLGLYALAWFIQHGEMPSLLVLDFVETGHTGSVKKKQITIENLAITISDIPDKIRKSEFTEGSDHTFCHHPIN